MLGEGPNNTASFSPGYTHCHYFSSNAWVFVFPPIHSFINRTNDDPRSTFCEAVESTHRPVSEPSKAWRDDRPSSKVCGQKYTCNITHLSEPIDVYSDWIDMCDKVNKKDGEAEEEDDL